MASHDRTSNNTYLAKQTGAEYIARILKEYGVSHVFLVMAILRKTLVQLEKLNIKRILTHSEKAAAYMADGYARMSGTPGICMAQSVGAANLAAGLQDPFLAHSPVIAITGRKKPIAQYRNAYQEIIHAPMYQPVTKYAANVDTIEQLPLLLCQAFREATTGAPGPVHLDMMGFAGESIETAEIITNVTAEKPYMRCPALRTIPEKNLIEQGVRLLVASSKPVIVVGGGAVFSNAADEIVQVAERLSIPVATSNDAKGIIPDIHHLSVGVVGSYSCQSANDVVSSADLVFYIGCGTGDQVTLDWTIPDRKTAILQIDINPSELGRSYPNTFGIAGDAKVALRQFLNYLPDAQENAAWLKLVQESVMKWKRLIEPLRSSSDLPIRPERLCKEISDMLPSNAVLVADTGYSAVWSSTMIYLKHSSQRYIRAAGSLGWAFPASLGVKCVSPDRPVICFTGDGAFWYHLAELETAKRCNINTITIVNNNSAFGQSIVGVNQAYGDDSGKREDVFGFESTDFAKIALDMGCLGIRVESPDEIATALEKAMAADRPVVIDVATDPYCKPPVPWKPPAQ